MTIKITLEKKEYNLILKLIQPEVDECEKMNNYGGDYGENLRNIKYKILSMTKNIRRLSQNQMEEILQKVSENLTVQFPNYNRAEYDQALIDLKNYQDRLNAIGDHVQGIKRID
jgi:hypothetical protein